MSTLATLTSSENGANSLADINANFEALNSDKQEASDISSAINTHKVIQTGIHGLAITASKTITATENTTLAGGTHSGDNTGDQTLPVKASGTEVDAGSNDAKFVTVKAINDSHNVPMVAPGTSGNVMTSDGTDWTSAALATGQAYAISASDNLKYSADTERTSTSGTYEKKKEIRIWQTGTFRVKFDLHADGAPTANGRLYKNGVAHGTEQTQGNTSYVTKSEDLDFTVGDKIQVYIHKGGGNTAYVCNFRIYYDKTATADGVVITD